MIRTFAQGLIWFAFLLLTGCDPFRPIHSSGVPITPEFGCSGAEIILGNHDNFEWTDVRISINFRFQHRFRFIGPGQRVEIPAYEFLKPDGTRLDLSAVACMGFEVSASTPRGQGWVAVNEDEPISGPIIITRTGNTSDVDSKQ